ncbi:MAG: VWA domain-containing protein [Sphaerochaetaceae bacterium]
MKATKLLGLILIPLMVVGGIGCDLGGTNSDEGTVSLRISVSGLEKFAQPSRSTTEDTRALVISDIINAKIVVDGSNFSDPVEVTSALSGGSGTVVIEDLDIGPNRIVTVYGLDGSNTQIPGALIASTVDLYPGSNSITVDWENTPRGLVFGNLLEYDRFNSTAYAKNISAASVQTKIEEILDDNDLSHPSFIDAEALADAIIGSSGSLPTDTSYFIEPATIDLTVIGLGAIADWLTEINVTDPASLRIALPGDGAFVIPNILPGDWEFLIDIDNGAYAVSYPFSIAPGETITDTLDLSVVLNAYISFGGAYENTSDTSTTDVISIVGQTDVDISTGKVSSNLSFTDQDSNPISNLNQFNFNIQESLDQASWKTISSGSITVNTVSNSGQGVLTALTMDYSGSMYSSDIANMVAATNSFIDNFGVDDGGLIVKFSDYYDIYTYPSAGGALFDKDILKDHVNNSYPTYPLNMTALFDAVGTAMEQLESISSTAHKAVIAFTDGMENDSNRYSKTSLIAYSNAHSIPIYSIGYGSYIDSATMQDIATSGVYKNSPNTAELEEIFNQIANIIKETYVIEWETTGTSGQTVYVKITVTYTSGTGTHTEETITSYTVD